MIYLWHYVIMKSGKIYIPMGHIFTVTSPYGDIQTHENFGNPENYWISDPLSETEKLMRSQR